MTDWNQLKVAPEGTHHLKLGAPAYEHRFDRVLKFHAPGLAPVAMGGQAWHILPDGQPAYSARFLGTFGFYEGLAAVRDNSGWFHVAPEGRAIYAQRYAWCGNFQEGLCTTRDGRGRYAHIDRDGHEVGARSWAYAGDFRDGLAVVQRDDGLSSHLNWVGELLHNNWFLDLDVFHKGSARARDAVGWFHIRRDGTQLYTRRFAMIEPFYNDQARVETLEGGLEIVDERGATLIQLRSPLTPAGGPQPQRR